MLRKAMIVILVIGLSGSVLGQTSGDPEIRVVHLSPDSNDLDVFIDDERAVQSVGFGDSAVIRIDPGSYSLTAVESGDDVEDAETVSEASFESDEDYTLVIFNRDFRLDSSIFMRDTSDPGDDSRVRIAHFSPDLLGVQAELENGESFSSNLKYRQISSYQDIEPGDYTLKVSEEGIGGTDFEQDIRIEEGQTSTIFISGLANRAEGLRAIGVRDFPAEENDQKRDGNGNGDTGGDESEGSLVFEQGLNIRCEVVKNDE